MTFISYAQNFEDVILWRVLKHIRNGFYIDVGANDPETDSVTKAFYDKGWCGLNLEPVDEWYNKLENERPRDINLKIFAGSQKGNIDFYTIANTGLSTCDESIAKRHEKDLAVEVVKTNVPVDTLTAIISHHEISTINFLKIDVEGAEKEVLLGIDLESIRPWIILVESTLPLTTIDTNIEWEEILVSANYCLAYSDGLNRFYLAREKQELLESFRYPPNFFDNFIRVQQLKSELCAKQAVSRNDLLESELEDAVSRNDLLESKLEDAVSRNDLLESELEDAVSRGDLLQIEIDKLNSELKSVYNSRSFRYAAPLRKGRQIITLVLQLVINLKRSLFC